MRVCILADLSVDLKAVSIMSIIGCSIQCIYLSTVQFIHIVDEMMWNCTLGIGANVRYVDADGVYKYSRSGNRDP